MKEKMSKKNNFTGLTGIFLLIFLISFASAMTIKSVATIPSEIAPGETARISIEIENTLGKDVENVNVILDLGGDIPIAPYQGSSEKSIDEIDEGDEEKFTFNVIILPEASPGIYKIPVKINYEINGTRETKNGTIGIVVNSPPQIRISVAGYLMKGQEKSIEIRIINDGLSGIKFVSVQATPPSSSATINSPLYEYLGNIDSDNFESVKYQIFVPETGSSSVLIPIKINYKDSTNKDFVREEVVSVRAYSYDEAQRLGLVQKQNYTLYILIGVIILFYLIYRIRKRMKRKKALGA